MWPRKKNKNASLDIHRARTSSERAVNDNKHARSCYECHRIPNRATAAAAVSITVGKKNSPNTMIISTRDECKLSASEIVHCE